MVCCLTAEGFCFYVMLRFWSLLEGSQRIPLHTMNTNAAQEAHELQLRRDLIAQTARKWRDYVDGKADGGGMMGASPRFRGLLDRLKTLPKRPKTLAIRLNDVRREIERKLQD